FSDHVFTAWQNMVAEATTPGVCPRSALQFPTMPQIGEQNPKLDDLAHRIEQSMLADRHRLRARLQHFHNQARFPDVIEKLQRLSADIERSAARRQRRLENLPKPSFPADLPVVQRRDEIARAIAENQVIVLSGETGSGKTTQLPKICLELGRGVSGMIGHTQPRRIAARAVAMRIAHEIQTDLGRAVGYKVRFNDQVSPESYIKVMTDGVLLAETQHDRFLDQYDTIIIDEAHERSLNIDFLLGYLKQLLPRRPDLKLIITSATIDPQRFSKHFNDAPMVEVSGRTYPVELRYRPPKTPDPEEDEQDEIDGILAAIDELWRDGPGDVLVFLSGEREIRETAEALRKHHPPGVEVLPLYARLSAEDQQKIFNPHAKPRIVLATNVAETSLTVPGVKYVVDPGHARITRYSARTRVQRLPVEKISRASADQRKGRCGRVSAGVCIRLYSEENFLARPAFTDPEILRTNLASVILQMKAFGLGNVEDFPFLDPPDYRMIRDGYQTLHELGAIDEDNQITQLGRQLARLPIDPRIARMVLAAQNEGVMEEVLIIAAALSVQDPRDRPMDKQEAADAAHEKFRDPKSDFLSYLKLWDWYHHQAKHLSQSKLRTLCQQEFLSFVRLREWHDVHGQLHSIVGEMGLGQARRDEPNRPSNQRTRGQDPKRSAPNHANANRGPTPRDVFRRGNTDQRPPRR
ncbi:MAG TPA: ATP-dependent RNA helicase HrpA, partial [Tepidisphaeraceae bacterium]